MSRGSERTLLESQYLLREKDMVVRRDMFQATGEAAASTACVLEYPDWVSAFAVTRDGSALFVHQHRNGTRSSALEIPGGWIEPSDLNPEAAIRRELLEETGHVFDRLLPLISISPNPATHDNRLHCFLALGGVQSAPLALDEDEQIRLVRFSLAEVESLIAAGKLLDNGHLTCVFYALLALGRLKWADSASR